jgi:hypothetical protein
VRSIVLGFVLLCMTCGCGGRAAPPVPFGVLDAAALHDLYAICPVTPLDKAQDPRVAAVAMLPKVFEQSVAKPVLLRCGHLGDKDAVEIRMVRDDESGRVLSFSLEFTAPDGQDKATVVDRILAVSVDPWLKVVSPKELRDLVRRADSRSEEVNGATWRVRANGSSTGAGRFISVDARLTTPE